VLIGYVHSIGGGVTMTTRILRVLCAVLAVLAVNTTATASAAAVESRPFMAEFTGVGSFAPTPRPGVLTGTGVGSGHATHLGKVNVSTSELLDFTVAPGDVTIRDGRLVMVAANGDELHWTYSGSGPVPDASGGVAFGGVFTITGGTGRFADATGSGTF
jgi:hypothetical protein